LLDIDHLGRFNFITVIFRFVLRHRHFIKITGQLSEGSFVRNGIVQIPKFDAKPNPNPNANPTLSLAQTLTLCLYVSDK